jgi:hypothetical protein
MKLREKSPRNHFEEVHHLFAIKKKEQEDIAKQRMAMQAQKTKDRAHRKLPLS